MIKIYYQEDTFFSSSLSVVVSYVMDRIPEGIEYICFKRGEIPIIQDSSDNYILLSILSHLEFCSAIHLLDQLSLKNINVVCGGQWFYSFKNVHDVLNTTDLISHICIGAGEEFLVSLIQDKLASGIYFAEDFDKISKSYITQKTILNNTPSVLIGLKGNSCDWGRCKFCDTGKTMRGTLSGIKDFYSVQENIKIMRYYIEEHDSELFMFYDNNTDPHDLKEIISAMPEDKKISIVCFGLRANARFDILSDVLKRKSNIKLCIMIGYEFFDDDILDIYQKGFNTADILNQMKWCDEHNVAYMGNVILGMPLISNRHIKNHLSFYKNFWDKGILPINKNNGFVLTETMPVYRESSFFKIIPKEYIKCKELQYGLSLPEDIGNLRLKYIDFDLYDEDERKYVDRTFTHYKYGKLYNMYDQMLKIQGIKFNFRDILRFGPPSEEDLIDSHLLYKDHNFTIKGVTI